MLLLIFIYNKYIHIPAIKKYRPNYVYIHLEVQFDDRCLPLDPASGNLVIDFLVSTNDL